MRTKLPPAFASAYPSPASDLKCPLPWIHNLVRLEPLIGGLHRLFHHAHADAHEIAACLRLRVSEPGVRSEVSSSLDPQSRTSRTADRRPPPAFSPRPRRCARNCRLPSPPRIRARRPI